MGMAGASFSISLSYVRAIFLHNDVTKVGYFTLWYWDINYYSLDDHPGSSGGILGFILMWI